MCSIFSAIFVFLENFQKPPGGLVIVVRRLMLTLVFSGFLPGTT